MNHGLPLVNFSQGLQVVAMHNKVLFGVLTPGLAIHTQYPRFLNCFELDIKVITNLKWSAERWVNDYIPALL